jgi:hypothetical protein
MAEGAAEDLLGSSFVCVWACSHRPVHLRNEPASRIGVLDLIMCVQAGRYGRLTPLVVNLLCYVHGDTSDIVVFMDGTPGESLSPFGKKYLPVALVASVLHNGQMLVVCIF